MKLLMILILAFTYLFSDLSDDQAYEAYKKGHYKKAFELYSKAYTTKADYNLAQFYEQGIGTKKDQQEALRYYDKVYENIDFHDYRTCENAMLPYYYNTLKKLHKTAESKALRRFCKDDRNPFVTKCPAAGVVPKFDRASLNEFDCFYYKRFPKSMKRLLHIHAKIKENDSAYLPILIKKYRPQMVRAIRPIISYYIKKGTKCISRAKTNNDVERCMDDYVDFLHKALLSMEISGGIRPTEEMLKKDPKLRKEMEDEMKRYEERSIFLQQTATKKDKEKAVKELKELHTSIDIYYQR
ncbi:hypothetical protein MNB_SV-10-903 [hydrothermal vent metagenome]|uniref:Beta-lactamase n=1 Tax=hydrothermal vent metagenome TaxID=652676 RepID=A0A1W1CN11_9ZZZZ